MLELLRAEVRRIWILYLRYPMDYVTGLVVMLVTTYMVVAGARYISGPTMSFGDRLDGILLGYWLWNLAMFSFSYTATAIHLEASAGTLEHVFLSPFGPVKIFLARSLASVGINVGTSTALLGLLLLITGRRLSFPALLLAPLVTLLVTTYGVGLLASALALLFKQINQLLSILQFLFIPLIFFPFEAWRGFYEVGRFLLPIAPSASLLRALMTRSEAPAAWEFLVAGANGIIYFALGVVMFRVADRQARRRGLLGQH